MRPYTGYYENPEEFEEIAYARSQALGKLLRAHRREERIRHENRHRDFNKDRMHRNEWDWDDENYDSYVDDSYDEFYEERKDIY